MDWTAFAKTIGTTTVALGVIGYFLRGVFGQVLSRELEKFKADLNAKHDIEIERLRNDLRIAASEHETRFTRLHETRAEAVAELYKRLVHAQGTFDAYLSKDHPDVKREDAWGCVHELVVYFREKRIYFEEGLCSDLDAAIEKFVNVFAWTGGCRQEMPGSTEKWSEAALHFGERFPAIRAKIERQFRELIGVHKTPSKGELTTDQQA